MLSVHFCIPLIISKCLVQNPVAVHKWTDYELIKCTQKATVLIYITLPYQPLLKAGYLVNNDINTLYDDE